jgi:hypothetical protein
MRSGSTIKGEVVANFNAPVRLSSIRVRIVGLQTIVDPQNSNDIAECATSTRFFEHEQQCWPSSAVLGDDTSKRANEVQELCGHMVFSFMMELPSNLPASFKWIGPDSSSASVEYKLMPLCDSAVDGRTEAGINTHVQSLKLLEALDLPLLMTAVTGNAGTKLKGGVAIVNNRCVCRVFFRDLVSNCVFQRMRVLLAAAACAAVRG